jgi:hypothetical protein
VTTDEDGPSRLVKAVSRAIKDHGERRVEDGPAIVA